jgi:S1-C subfamily serine protease
LKQIHLKKTAIIFLLLLTYTLSYAQNENPPAPQKSYPITDRKDDDLNAEQIIEQNKSALVSIWYHTDSYSGYYYLSVPKDTTLLSGSGFIFDSKGFVGTNYHVIDGFDSLMIKTADGVFYNAELVFVDEKNDIAILQIINLDSIVFQAVKIGNSDLPRVGQNVYAIGSPLGFEYTISEGIIAALRDHEKVSFNDPTTYELIEKTFDKVIQITAAISPGNSGGALFNSKGEVIGITTYSYGFYGNLNFAIAINSFSKIRNTIDFETIDKDEAFIAKKNDNLFKNNFRLAESFKTKVYSSWIYSKQKDTMKVYDTMIVKQDSLNKVNLMKAENYYNICIEMQPDTFYIYQSLMDLYIYTENFNKAEPLYGTIKEKFTSDSLLNTFSSSLAMAYSTSKDYKKALMFYEKLQKKDSNDVYVLYQMADLYGKQKETKKSEDVYRKIIKKDPNYIMGYIQLGRLYYEQKDFKSAKKYLNDALEKTMLEDFAYGNYLDLHYYRGLIAVEEGRKLDAIMCYIDMKSTYSYTKEENEKKLGLYKAIKKMEE